MAWAQTCKIDFAARQGRRAFYLHRAVSVRIERSVEALTATARVELPRKLYFALGLQQHVRTGDPIRIALGYNGHNRTEFEGYVVRTQSADKVEVICEDEMWRLKQTACHGLWPRTTLAQFLGSALPEGAAFEAGDWALGDLRATRTNVAAVLASLQEQYHILSYMDGHTLVSGKPYSYRTAAHAIELGRLQLAVNLEYQSASEIRAQVRAQSLLAGGRKLEVTVGDTGGALSKLLYSGIESEAELRALAQADLDRLKRDGWRGTFDWVGAPSMAPGERVALSDLYYPERAGSYHIDGVTKTWGPGGYRQKVKLGLKTD